MIARIYWEEERIQMRCCANGIVEPRRWRGSDGQDSRSVAWAVRIRRGNAVEVRVSPRQEARAVEGV